MKKVKRRIEDYNDIIKSPRHVSNNRKPMAVLDRAAQFAPFAAVVGHEAAVKETARLTDAKKELDETEKAVIDDKLREITAWLPKKRTVELVYFVPDSVKKGGTYLSKLGFVKKINTYTKEVVFADGAKIAVNDIYSIQFY